MSDSTLRRRWRQVTARLEADDWLTLAGLGFVAAGLGAFSVALAAIAVGVVLLYLGIWGPR